MAAVFHLDRDSARADGHDEVDLGLTRSFGKMAQVEAADRQQVGPDDALGKPTRKVAELWVAGQSFGGQRNDLL
jgi:hypothetical protein